jgi:hypothetical protein
MRQASLATLILQAVAAEVSNQAADLEKLVDNWPKPITEVVTRLLAPPPQPLPADFVPTGAAAADIFLLQSVNPHQQLLEVLKSQALLTKLTIPKWFVNESIVTFF